MTLKARIRSAIQSSGFDVVRFVPELNRPFSILPMLVRERIAREEPFFFVQVGANDGVLDDPLRDLVCQHHLNGLLIEPLPDLFEKLKLNYHDESQLYFENVAIINSDGIVLIHRVRNSATVPHHWHGIASFTRENLLKQGVPPEYIETVSVRGVSLHSILEKYKITDISLLQIDTEGFDDEIIRFALEAGCFPEIINYEHCWLVPSARFKCKQMLDSHGYQFVEVGKDTLAIRKSG